MIIFLVLITIYVLGVAAFTLYASAFNHGWGNGYKPGPSLVFAAQWPWTLIKLAIKNGKRP